MNYYEGYHAVEKDARLYYCKTGNNEPLTLVPGASALAADFNDITQHHSFIFYDERGRGKSDPVTDDSALWSDYAVADLESLRGFFGLEKCCMLGWSNAAGVVALYAMAHIARISRLVFMCPASPRSKGPYRNQERERALAESRMMPNAREYLEELRQQKVNVKDPVAFCREYQRLALPRQMGKPEAADKMKSDPCACANEWVDTLSAHYKKHAPASSWERDWRPGLATLDVPALIIHGAEDLIPLESSQEWARTLPNARLIVIDGVGHYPHLEAPAVFFSALDCFLKGKWPKDAEKI